MFVEGTGLTGNRLSIKDEHQHSNNVHANQHAGSQPSTRRDTISDSADGDKDSQQQEDKTVSCPQSQIV